MRAFDRPVLYIEKKKIQSNLTFIKSKTDSTFICPMVKANAYGVGDTLVVSQLLEWGLRNFGVARVREGEKLRRFFPNQDFDILVFCSLDETNIFSYIHNGLSPVVCTRRCLEVLRSLAKEERKKLPPLHIKFDLGMMRFGLPLEDSFSLSEEVRKMGLSVAGLCGHFPKGNEVTNQESATSKSLEDLVSRAADFGVTRDKVHVPNSEALLSKERFGVGLRPGIALYGLSQEKDVETSLMGALTLKAPLIALKKLSKGGSVSYGGLWRSSEETKIGVLPVGYADGLRRGLSNRIKFCLRDKSLVDQVGAICMDFCMINLGLESQAKEGDEVVLFDSSYSQLYRWSRLLGTIPYEIITGLGDRIERKLI